jgi:hypothetical protein
MAITKSPSALELQEEIRKLKKLEFFARYGDYFVELCRNIKVMAEKSRIAGWQTVTNTYWTDVAKRIQNEKPTTKNI